MLAEKIFATFGTGDSSLAMPDLSRSLVDQQARAWPMLAEGRGALAAARTRRIACSGFDVLLQYNPRRIVSTGAKTDPASIKARRCFLCVEHLPPEQQGILYRDHFLVLCNPAPIFDGHLTISSISHQPQILRPWIPTLLSLASDLSPSYTVLYNGARCGASAPDHLHFQSAPTGAIPVENDLASMQRWSEPLVLDDISVARAKEYGREVVLLIGSSAVKIAKVLEDLLAVLPHDPEHPDEPKINVMASYGSHVYRLLVFPRIKHRPAAYFLEGDAKVTVSPAVVDIGGLIITPVEKDFNMLTASGVEGIFREVSATQRDVEEALTKLKQRK
jgi:hypothetical protein